MESLSELIEKCQGSKLTGKPWHYRLHRMISIRLTQVLILIRVTPNMVSVSGVLLGVLGAAVIAVATGLPAAAGVVLLYAYYLADRCDGELARYYGRASRAGQVLDHIGHLVVETALFAGFGWNLYQRAGRPAFLVLAGLIALERGVSRVLCATVLDRRQADERRSTRAHKMSNERRGILIWVTTVVNATATFPLLLGLLLVALVLDAVVSVGNLASIVLLCSYAVFRLPFLIYTPAKALQRW